MERPGGPSCRAEVKRQLSRAGICRAGRTRVATLAALDRYLPMQAPPVSRILETSLYVADLDRAEQFYREVFGFGRLLRDERMCALAIPGRQVLLLFRRGGSVAPSQTPFGPIPPHDGHGTQHLCFSVTHAGLEQWPAHLARCGIAIESRLDWSKGGSSLYFRDPDGHSLEVGTPGLWQNDPVDGDGSGRPGTPA